MVRKDEQEGQLVVFRGGWADLEYWSGRPSDEPVTEAPGWDDWMTFLISSSCSDGSPTASDKKLCKGQNQRVPRGQQERDPAIGRHSPRPDRARRLTPNANSRLIGAGAVS